jgi:hypothetical protein
MWCFEYHEGRLDYQRGADVDYDNPYNPYTQTDKYHHWQRGWLCAELDWVVEVNGDK